jgi:hypothetical protein
MKISHLCILGIILSVVSLNQPVKAELTGKGRNILAKEAELINLPGVLITEGSWNKLPDYHDRDFWQNIPDQVRQEYITKAEEYLNYDWPVVKATDYLEFVRPDLKGSHTVVFKSYK